MTILIKLGGSVLTHKEQLFSFRHDAARRLGEEIRISRSTPIVVHGTGKTGKAYARHYTQKATSDRDVFQLTTAAINGLQGALCRTLYEAGLATCPIPANTVFHREGNSVHWYDPRVVARLLQGGVLPVLCGDVLVDGPSRFAIISSDTIVTLVAQALPVQRCFFVTDVDGVLGPDGRPVPEIVGPHHLDAHESDRDDVTGGMTAKLEAALEVARAGTAVTILNGTVPGRLAAALRGELVVATRIPAGTAGPSSCSAAGPQPGAAPSVGNVPTASSPIQEAGNGAARAL